MVKMSFSPSVQKKKWTKSGQNPVIYQGFFDFPGRAIFSTFSWFFTVFITFIVFVGPHSLNEFSHIDYKILNSAKSVVKSLEPCCRLCNTTFYDSFFEVQYFEAWEKQRRKLVPCCSKNHRRNRQLAQLRLWTFWSDVDSTSELRRSNPTLSEFGKLK